MTPNDAMNPITEDDIANYLANTPDFFARHSELLAAVQLTSPHSHRTVSLQDLLGNEHLFGAVAAWLRGERDPDRVAQALLQEDGKPGGAGDDALHPQPRLGEAEVERIVSTSRKHPVDVDQILHPRHFGAQDDPVVRQSDRFGESGGPDGALDHRIHGHVAGISGA